MKTLFYRLCTVAMVCLHYILIEKIKIGDRVQNEMSLLVFILAWHIIFMNFKNAEESRRKKNEEIKFAVAVLIILLMVVAVLTVLATPVLAWFNFEVTSLYTDYWTLRYLMMFVYITFNIVINAFPLVNNFLFFLSDGIILS